MSDEHDDELINALAAFGEDAMSLLDDDDDEISPEMLAEFEAQNATTAGVSLAEITDCDHDSPMMRYVKQINRAIYTVDDLQESQSAESSRSRIVVFAVGCQKFGVPFNVISEIARYPNVTELPFAPSWLRGVTNLRGNILSVTDLRNLLDLSGERPAVGEKIIVVRSKRHAASTAIVVDHIIGLFNANDEQGVVDDSNEKLAKISSGTAQVDDAETIFIDPDQLFQCAELFPSLA